MFASGFQSNMNFLNVAYSQNKMMQPVPKKEDVITEKVKFIYIIHTIEYLKPSNFNTLGWNRILSWFS